MHSWGVNGPPGHPPYKPRYESSFGEDRVKVGLSGPDFDHHFEKLARSLRDYPFGQSVEIPNGDGIRLQPTYEAAPDLPAMCLLYQVEENPNEIVFLGLTPAWTDDDIPPF